MLETLGPYTILQRLGSGGMGEVYLAEDERLGRRVALKVLSAQRAGDAAQQAQLREEARAIALLDHPSICTLYEVGECDRGVFIAMQFIEGETLAVLISQRRLTLGEVIHIGLQAADALHEAHGKGLLHRDLKPQNLMRTPKGALKIVDFGLAIPYRPGEGLPRTASQPGLAIGTVPYMSPEQVRGDALDGRSDLFSLGAVLYELAAGRRAFAGESAVDVLASILKDVPPDGIEGQWIHPGLGRILNRLLEKDPLHRMADGAQLKEALEKLQASLTGTGALDALPTVPATFTLRARRWMRTAPRWAMAAGFIGLLIGAAMALPLAWRGPTLQSLVVLPIANDTGDPEIDDAADGLTEAVIDQLSRSPHLRVIGSSSVWTYKGRPSDLSSIAQELRVQGVLMGRLVPHQGSVHLRIELIDVRDQRQLWGDQILRPLEDLQSAQGSIVASVARHLGVRMPEPRGHTKPEAYDLFLKGLTLTERHTRQEEERALLYFQQALDRDSSYAWAHMGKAKAYRELSTRFRPASDVMPKALQEAELALRIDPHLADAYSIRGYARIVLGQSAKEAEEDLHRGITLHPGSSFTHVTYARFLISRGRFPEAITMLHRALELDPKAPAVLEALASAQILSKEYAAALDTTRRMKLLEPDSERASLLASHALFFQGRTQAALDEIQRAAASGNPHAFAWKGYCLGKGGRKREALELLARLNTRSKGSEPPVTHADLALLHLGLGDPLAALDELDAMALAHEEESITLRHAPSLLELHGNPRFEALLRRIP